ncbi:MAG: protein-export chaperone SecB [Gallionellales bacterium CG_4_10_14_3_um_filter_54_96]|nr:protein-export chaperone SecB [Gallionella sp.]OIO73518.1 MAG: protein-export chaperone SecB [Gallionellaceae bacterium CG1_02_56_997]PIV14920.1 MAG: protein-export chaperone SecB [Gallionellales bacterium CG03_land_8_20_14_0_80_55_15]PIV92191.1 MAG: protein-export chaperone SecB [Gallionellales bacterium CG17_big_fil_post_rev_8_21_14_2_50_54_146]PIX04047.1 MAG: protein-export chaperone SecB [Gallionellales bacterium CG_4_8_14_3_um_filter_54_18]PIY03403.1 MAG: protein-export chaperone SecB 
MTDAATTQPVFNMDKIYVKDISLEIPHAPQIFLERENPQIEVQLQTSASTLDNGVNEVTILATVTAKIGEKVMFLIEAKQAGIFTLRNLPEAEMEPVLAVMCPNILFPYLREVVSDVSVRAGFAPVMLNPINFEVLYQQQKQQQAEAAAATTH